MWMVKGYDYDIRRRVAYMEEIASTLAFFYTCSRVYVQIELYVI